MFPQNIHHLFCPRRARAGEWYRDVDEQQASARGEFHCPAALCLKWATGPVSRPDPCMGKHTGLHRLQATTSISSCTTKRCEKREAVILDVLFWWLALWHLTSSKTIDTPVTVTLADGTWRGLSGFIISLELLLFSCSPHISGAFSLDTERLWRLITQNWVFLWVLLAQNDIFLAIFLLLLQTLNRTNNLYHY